jgi:hypothetical protein
MPRDTNIYGHLVGTVSDPRAAHKLLEVFIRQPSDGAWTPYTLNNLTAGVKYWVEVHVNFGKSNTNAGTFHVTMKSNGGSTFTLQPGAAATMNPMVANTGTANQGTGILTTTHHVWEFTMDSGTAVDFEMEVTAGAQMYFYQVLFKTQTTAD